MPESSLPPTERARKTVSLILRSLQEPGRQAAIAVAMGTSEATISRLKNDTAEQFALFLAHAGLKVVPSEARCFNADYIEALRFFAKQHLVEGDVVPKLEWD